jgi:hypothetical protein
MRGTSSPTSVHGQLAQALWEGDSSSESIEELADVIFVIMQRDAGMPAPKWDLEEEVVLGE